MLKLIYMYLYTLKNRAPVRVCLLGGPNRIHAGPTSLLNNNYVELGFSYHVIAMYILGSLKLSQCICVYM